MPDDGICCDKLQGAMVQENSPLAKIKKVEMTSPTTWLMLPAVLSLRTASGVWDQVYFCPFCGHKMRG